MVIDRIGPLEPIPPGKKTGRSEQVGGNDRADSINISSHAVEKAERYQVLELIKSAPDLDEARIAELRQKINDPSYMNEAVIKATADNIVNSWFA
jgi:negative regulator of flagellin synthesis FlgM